MAVIVNGVSHPSIADASDFFNVSTRTIREWIEKGIIPHPPTIDYGTRELQVFTDEYLRSAVVARKEYRQKKKSERPPIKRKDVITVTENVRRSDLRAERVGADGKVIERYMSTPNLPGDPTTPPR